MFTEDEYESAKSSFIKALNISPESKKIKLWLRKCNAELEDELQYENSNKMKEKMEEEKMETKIEPKMEEKKIEENSKQENQQIPIKPAPRFRHEWFQTDSLVTVELFAKSIKTQDLNVSINEQNLVIVIKITDGNEFILDLELFDKIIPSESSYVLLSTKIEIKLKKQNLSRWKTLENTGDNPTLKPNHAQPALVYPSSRGAKNWDDIVKSEPEEEPTGDHALDKLFKDIFKGGTEEQRKAMMKSYVESGGTVLSTNWDEVGSKKVEGQAPSGLEMKSWNEDK